MQTPLRVYVLVLPVFLALCSPQGVHAQIFRDRKPSMPAGEIQVGFQVSYVEPRNEWAIDFARTPAFELYCQFRSDEGNGPWTGRIGLFYSTPKARQDTSNTYIVQSNPDAILPGFIVYKELNFKGLFIDYAYSLVNYKRIRLDMGLGLIVGQYHMKYTQEYKTVISVPDATIEDYFVGLRPKLSIGYQLNKYLELYGEYKDAIVTSTDWSANFGNNAFGLGINFTFKPHTANDY